MEIFFNTILLVDKQSVFPKLTQIMEKQGMKPTFADVWERHSILRRLFLPNLVQQPYLGN